MNAMHESITILIAANDPVACRLTKEALQVSGPTTELRLVHNGEALLDYLGRRGAYSAPGTVPRPSLIMLDLQLPRMDGIEALATIKATPELRRIPVVVLTTSRSEEDIRRSHDLGAASFISKPVTFNGLVELSQSLGRYWFELAYPPTD